MNFYSELENALLSADINTKELIVDRALEFCQNNSIEDANFTPKIITKPSYAKVCKIVQPKELPKRKDFNSNSGLIALLHSIAHIEFSAIDLAIDAVYRFPKMPKEYKIDWLIVAKDEIRHFKMLQSILNSLDAKYGDLPVHKGLFEIAFKTKDSAIDRMAVVPRYFEASGLDVNPKIIKKLESFKSKKVIQDTIEALNIIYNEEIEHVKKGDKWFKYLAKKEGSNYKLKYLEIVNRYNLKSRAGDFNIKARKMAGFSCDELKSLGAKKC